MELEVRLRKTGVEETMGPPDTNATAKAVARWIGACREAMRETG
jgi:hypothetical protein